MNAPLQPPRVVIAASAEGRRRLRAILPWCELRFAETEGQLLRELAEKRCDMLIVGAHFQESSAIAAIERVLKHDETVPVVCIRGKPFAMPLGKAALDALGMASRALGARNFIDLLEYPDDEAGNARVRAMLEGLLPRRLDQSSSP